LLDVKDLDSRLTDDSKIVSLARRPLLYSPETVFLYFWYSFLLEAEYTTGSQCSRLVAYCPNHYATVFLIVICTAPTVSWGRNGSQC
jgi:hypothetical protein